jgi:hypothetical protein
MSRVKELYNLLKDNAERIEATQKRLHELATKKEKTDLEIDLMQSLYRQEFSLYMDNSSIYDDLMGELQKEDEFTKRRFQKEALKFLKVEVIEI